MPRHQASGSEIQRKPQRPVSLRRTSDALKASLLRTALTGGKTQRLPHMGAVGHMGAARTAYWKTISMPSVKFEVFPGFASRNQHWKFQVSPASTE